MKWYQIRQIFFLTQARQESKLFFEWRSAAKFPAIENGEVSCLPVFKTRFKDEDLL